MSSVLPGTTRKAVGLTLTVNVHEIQLLTLEFGTHLPHRQTNPPLRLFLFTLLLSRQNIYHALPLRLTVTRLFLTVKGQHNDASLDSVK